MVRQSFLALAMVGMVGLVGCGSTTFNRFDPGNGTSISIDAKQRAIYTIEKDFTGSDQKWRAICAEPSPDALAALSSSGSLDAATLGKAIGLAFASQEGAASIGLRTQTITILRDAMYRLCEGYASGALDDIGFARLQRRYQSLVIGLLAIEQLTGAVVANQVSIGGSATARLGQSQAKATVMVQEAKAAEVVAKAATTASKAKLETATQAEATAKKSYEDALAASSNDDKAEAVVKAKAGLDAAIKNASDTKTDLEKAQQKEAIATSEVQSLEALRKDLDRASLVASVSGQFAAPSRADSPAAAASAVEKTADTVKAIVEGVVTHDYTRETCLDTLLSRTARRISGEGNSDYLELAVRYCVYALEARGAEVSPGKGAEMAAASTAFLKAAEVVFHRRREREQAFKLEAEKDKDKKTRP